MPYFIWLRTVIWIEKWHTPAELKKAYRKISVKYHPDRNPWCDKSEKMMKKITKAYEILTDEEKMAEFEKEERTKIKEGQKAVSKKKKKVKNRKKKKKK